jgi:hypothetical protein
MLCTSANECGTDRIAFHKRSVTGWESFERRVGFVCERRLATAMMHQNSSGETSA